jgi:hypothetical protein
MGCGRGFGGFCGRGGFGSVWIIIIIIILLLCNNNDDSCTCL